MADGLARPNTILVSASGKVETAPDIATMTLSIRGEGKTPDAATAALAVKQKAIFAGLRGLDPKLEVRTGDIGFREVRGGNCTNFADSDGAMSMAQMADDLSDAATMASTDAASGPSDANTKGPCRVVGHRATTETSIRIASVKDAGTAVGLAGRLGATNAHVENFGLRDDTAAARRALDQAMANARTQAAALAAASGSKLGPVVSIMNGDVGARSRVMAMESYSMMMPAVAAPPIVVDITPTPVETSAQLVVTFALLP
ncbi:SIMPL domain-containing protein [Sphingomonas sp. MMS24-J45]|uniref:SIMPL domain-containing protein n=1 Tax=Sphingomonas sp. MMS24-J45 TaxID=3238806 RepID=UPI00384CDE3C